MRKMRRKDAEVTETELIDSFLGRKHWGVLAMVDENGAPYQAPVNFAVVEGDLCFHSSVKGRKMDCIRRNGAAHFSVVEDLSYIPSYYSDPELACPATQYFLSVSLEGAVTVVEDPAEKARIMTALMEKHQPEGRYLAIDPEHPGYKKEFRGTAVMRMKVSHRSAKFKAGQNLSPEKRANFITLLREHGGGIQRMTADWMERLA